MRKTTAVVAGAFVIAGGYEAIVDPLLNPEAARGKAAVITLGASATRMPQSVEQSASSVVQVKSRVMGDKDKLVMGSGVRVPGGFLTSGHMFRNENNTLNSPCFTPHVLESRSESRLAVWGITRAASVRFEGERAWTDLAYLSYPFQAGRPAARMSETPKDLSPGEEVFFVNYQPTSDGKQRGPGMSGPYKRPAIYSGYILDDPKGNSNQITVLTGAGQNYGAVKDTEGRPGSSGGPLFTRDGQLFAVTSALDTTIAGLKTPDEKRQIINERYGVKVQGAATKLQVIYAQPVDKTVVDPLASSAQQLKTCPR